MCSGGLVLKPQGEPGTKPTMYIFSIPLSLAGTSCHVLSGPGVNITTCSRDKPAHYEQFSLYSHVIGWELMSCALGPGVETTK